MKDRQYKTAALSLNLSPLKGKIRKRLLLCLFTLAFINAITFIFPQVLFSNKFHYGRFTVYSDKKIDSGIQKVLNAAILKIKQSELYDSNLHFNIFLCNTKWRFNFFSFGNANAGGITHTRFTGNIFIRKCNISKNSIIPPDSWVFAKAPHSLADRPLSYFIAHEMIHRLQFYRFGSLANKSTWIREGYADYIAKGNEFNFAKNLDLSKRNEPEMNPQLGLYKYYHLLVYYLIREKRLSIKQIVETNPSSSEVEKEMLNMANK